MKSSLFIILLTFFYCLDTHAEIPRKSAPQTYSSLWTNSPFTTKPIIINNGPTESPFKDLHLTGIAPIEGGYRIVISNKKDKLAKKIIIEPGINSGYEVLAVNRNPDEKFGTTVTLKNGAMEGVVRFEPSLVVLNNPAPSTPANQIPPGINPNQPNQPNQPNNGQAETQKPTRSRIVPPVKPSQNNSNNTPQSRSSRSR